MARRIQLNHGGMAAMLKSGEVRAELNRAAEQMKAAAQQASPIGPEEGGHYRDRFEIENRTTDRAKVILRNTSPYAAQIEARQRILGSAIDAGRS
jgi:type II secretory pathway component PulJ